LRKKLFGAGLRLSRVFRTVTFLSLLTAFVSYSSTMVQSGVLQIDTDHSSPIGPRWQIQAINTVANLRGLSVVGETVWASGSSGTFIKTIDGGRSWQVGQVAGAEKLDFRDVEAFSSKVAYLLSIGNGEASRIYKTTDGGDTWQLQFQNTEQDAFFDALAFWDERHGLALSDPVRGHFYLVGTSDGGAHWTPLPAEGMPAAINGEGGFAASGTCLIARGKSDAWLVSGGSAARVFHTNDRGQKWTVVDSPLLRGPASAGVFSIAFSSDANGVIVGGDYQKPEGTERIAARTGDAGKSWQLLLTKAPSGFRSGAAFTKLGSTSMGLTVGTSGTDLSHDGGLTWQSLDREDFNSVAFNQRGVAWAVGPKGRIGRMDLRLK
jgi:photosystem II stability/assembly factor-like uncharacterized protein